MWTFPRDTLPPRLDQVRRVDSVAATLTFVGLIDPYQSVEDIAVRVRLLPDSAEVPGARLWRQARYDSVRIARRAAMDSAMRDTMPLDTLAPDTGVAQEPVAPDTAEAAAPAPDPLDELLGTRPALERALVVEIEGTWLPDSRYLIDLIGARSANGVRGDTTAIVLTTLPLPSTPEDSTPPDTSARG